MADIFISYAREDRGWVERLAHGLEARGWSVWWDRRIPAGKTFREVIGRELAAARCVIVVWSVHAIASDWVAEEAEDGRSRSILVPVFKEQVRPPLGFGTIQAADLSHWEGAENDQTLLALVEDLTALLGRPSVTPTPRPDLRPNSEPPVNPLPALAIPRSQAVEVPALAFPFRTFVRIPAGEFLMGTSDEDIERLLETTAWAKDWKEKGYFKDEQPQHVVMLDEYRTGKCPVTNAEYEAFVKGVGRAPPSHWPVGRLPKKLAKHPVVNVSWDDANAYCQWLTTALRTADQLGANEVVRLPTEAEWEKAARGTDGRFYPWGDDWDASRCNSSEGAVGTTTPVGQYSPQGESPYGVGEMAGNVWEWCADIYENDYYERVPPWRNPKGPAKGDTRVLRGGSFDDTASSARCADRYGYSPDLRIGLIGFRVVASPFSS